MSVKYDRSADALYVYLNALPVALTKDLGDGRAADFAEDGTVIGVEFIGASQGIDLSDVPESHAVQRELEPFNFRMLV